MLHKSIDVLTAFTGKKPKGFTAPAWTPSRETVCSSVSEFGKLPGGCSFWKRRRALCLFAASRSPNDWIDLPMATAY